MSRSGSASRRLAVIGGVVARRAAVAMLMVVFLATGLGTSALATTSRTASPPAVHPADTTGGCALPDVAQWTPATAAWKLQAAATTKVTAKVGASTKTTSSTRPRQTARTAATSHVVPGQARNTPTTGYAARTVAPSDTTVAAIKGTVTGPSGTPLADIQVLAYSQNNWFDASTATDGTYSVDVAADAYTVYFYDPNGAHPAGYYSSAGFKADQHLSTTVTVTGSNVTGISVRLPAPIWIKGRVTGPGGINLGDIRVGAYSDAYNNGGTSWTASDGLYAIAVAPGTYTVGFDDSAGTYASGYYRTSGYTSDPTAATPVVVTAADVTGISVQLPLAVHIQGTVTGPGNAPVPNINVSVLGSVYSYYPTTGPDGIYSVAVNPGTYHVEFDDPNGTYVTGYYASSGFTTDSNAATPVAATTADVPNISVRLPTPIFIRGKVTGPSGDPLENIDVSARSALYLGNTSTAADG
jgi:protocatechuate 3,4-dioxygenase beta subunit